MIPDPPHLTLFWILLFFCVLSVSQNKLTCPSFLLIPSMINKRLPILRVARWKFTVSFQSRSWVFALNNFSHVILKLFSNTEVQTSGRYSASMTLAFGYIFTDIPKKEYMGREKIWVESAWRLRLGTRPFPDYILNTDYISRSMSHPMALVNKPSFVDVHFNSWLILSFSHV